MSKLTAENLMKSFPYALSRSEAIRMIAEATAEEIKELADDNRLLDLYGRIDELDGELLDALAYDFRIEWWDANAPIESKRKTFLECFAVHRKLGTAGAVKTALTAMYEGAKVIEWFEEGGTPYHYRIEVNLGDKVYNADTERSIRQRTKIYGNVRSTLDGIGFVSTGTNNLYVGCAVATGEKTKYTVGTE